MTDARSLERSIGPLDAATAARVAAAAADIALVVDGNGVIQDLAVTGTDIKPEDCGPWIGRPWVETVASDSRGKVEQLLREAGSMAAMKGREVNQASAEGASIPIRFSAVQVGADGRILAIGRDLRTVSRLQQRLVELQRNMEREYARLRHAETRYRVLFQLASEAILIVDAGTLKIVDANPSAADILGLQGPRLNARALTDLFDTAGRDTVGRLLATARATGRADAVTARLARGRQDVSVSAALFRQDTSSHYLVRLNLSGSDGAARGRLARLPEMMARLPEGFVVADPEGTILEANAAFLEMAQLASVEQARGVGLERWIGRAGVDLPVLMSNLKSHGAVRDFGTILRGEFGTVEEVEISAVAVDGDEACIGLVLRQTPNRRTDAILVGRDLPRSASDLTDLIGRVPLKDLVRETTDVIERLCIEAALKLTGDNRASAAQMLGLSRQSLYAKLRRYGLGDLDGLDEGEDADPV